MTVSPSLAQAVLDSLPNEIAVLTPQGGISAVNAAWNRFAQENGASSWDKVGVGTNYVEITTLGAQEGSEGAQAVLDGLLRVLSGESPFEEFEYPCPSPTQERWFVVQIMPLIGGEPGHIVVQHLDVTSRRLAIEMSVRDRQTASRDAAEAREVATLQQMASPETSLTAQSYGMLRVKDSLPGLFNSMVERYILLLDRAVEMRAYKGEEPLSGSLRQLAQDMRHVAAGPRDVLDLHVNALKRRLLDLSPALRDVYLVEARALVLELMGQLLSLYRTESFGSQKLHPKGKE